MYMYCLFMFIIIVYSLQSLRKRFSQYAFLWEQDVLATFDDFLRGVAQPHPQRFTRPETVTRSRSATHSARPKRYLLILHVHVQCTSTVLHILHYNICNSIVSSMYMYMYIVQV